MFDKNHYVPILKWRMGEYQALLHLKKGVADWVTPLIEIPTEGWDFEKEAPSKSLDDHLSPFGKRLYAKWGDATCFIDSPYLDAQAKMKSGTHHLEHIFELARTKDCQAIPVTGIRRHAAYINAVRRIIKEDDRGVCIRLTQDDFNEALEVKLDRLLDDLKTDMDTVDLVIDLADGIVATTNTQALVWKALLDQLPYLNDWNTLTIAGTSFPSSLPAVLFRPSGQVPRYEWLAYQRLINAHKLERVPSFGDYATSHPVTASMDPRMLDPNAKIKYTIHEESLVVVGKQVKLHGRDQYVDLCKSLIAMKPAVFAGPAYSWGDKYIADCATKTVGTGGTSTWPTVATNHHITKAVRDLANFHGTLPCP
jgi:hypothetical protein